MQVDWHMCLNKLIKYGTRKPGNCGVFLIQASLGLILQVRIGKNTVKVADL